MDKIGYLILLWLALASVLGVVMGRWIKKGSGNYLPTCFGSRPGPQQKAENGCDDCEVNDLCLRRIDNVSED